MGSSELVEHYRGEGVARLPHAFSTEAAAQMAEAIWTELERAHGVRRDDRATWSAGAPRGLGRLRTERAFAAIGSLVLDPTVSSDSRFLATVSGVDGSRAVVIEDLESGRRMTFDEGSNLPVGHFSWSVDGRSLAYARLVSADGTPGATEIVILTIEADGSIGGDPTVLRDPSGVGWDSPEFQRSGNLLVVERPYGAQVNGPDAPDVVRVVDPATGEVRASVDHPRRIVDQRYDPSGTWLLVTYVDGTLAWYGAGGSGTIAEGFVAADW